VKLFDESELGGGVFVTARVGRPGFLEWERTDIYDIGEVELDSPPNVAS
jgi:hypothetical protein